MPILGKKQLSETIERKKQKSPDGTRSISCYSDGRKNPYVARINNINGKRIVLGSFPTRADAIRALDAAHVTAPTSIGIGQPLYFYSANCT